MSFDYKTWVHDVSDITYLIERMDEEIQELTKQVKELEIENKKLREVLNHLVKEEYIF